MHLAFCFHDVVMDHDGVLLKMNSEVVYFKLSYDPFLKLIKWILMPAQTKQLVKPIMGAE